MKDRGIYEAGKPFLMEVVFDGDDINKETDRLIGRSLARGADLLPGLKVNKVYAKFATLDLAVVDNFREDLRDLKKSIEHLLRKYGVYQDELHDKAIEEMKKEG